MALSENPTRLGKHWSEWAAKHPERAREIRTRATLKWREKVGKEYIREQENSKERRRHRIEYWYKVKLEALVHYSRGSPKCARCEFSDVRALQIDHILGGGKKQQNIIGKNNFYQWLKRKHYPPGYQVLCANCNWIKKEEKDENRGPKR